MSLEVGIVGLPNVGKSTLFSAITSIQAEVANYPFCTVEPNVGIVNVPDDRLLELARVFQPQKITYNIIKFFDIAGLVKGASQGEGLGNQFLANIRNVDVIAHVVRCFRNDDILHVNNQVNPISDINTINSELILADMLHVEKRIEKVKRKSKGHGHNVASIEIDFLQRLLNHLTEGNFARAFLFNQEEQTVLNELDLITLKPSFYVMNVSEDELVNNTDMIEEVLAFAEKQGCRALKICAQLEHEMTALEDTEKKAFLQQYQLEKSGLDLIIQEAFKLLNQISFLTAGKEEVRAWNISVGDNAAKAAGKIHSDIERGFIKAELYHFDDFLKLRSEQAIREAGKLRIEGRDYTVNDGDVIYFRFNV